MVRFFRAEDQLTPVHVAVIWGKAKILHLLLCNGGDPTRRDEVGGCQTLCVTGTGPHCHRVVSHSIVIVTVL